MIKMLQINVDRRRAAQDLVFQTATTEKADLILVPEPNKTWAAKNGYFIDESMDACIIKMNPNIKIIGWGKGRGHVWVRLEMYVFCVYNSPNATEDTYQEHLEDLADSMSGKGRYIVIGGDYNAKSPLWGSPIEDRRGTAVLTGRRV